MDNKDYTWFFIFMAFLNTNIGLSNHAKNDQQEEKIDKILLMLEELLEKKHEQQ